MPVKFDLTDESREAVMDASPWTYAIAAMEMRREGKIADDPPPGHQQDPDPAALRLRRGLRHVGNAALGELGRSGRPRSKSAGGSDLDASDRGLPQYRIVRDGCFTHRDAAAGGDAPVRYPCVARAGVRAAAGGRRRRGGAGSGSTDPHQQDVHARRARSSRPVDPEMGRDRRRSAPAASRSRSRFRERRRCVRRCSRCAASARRSRASSRSTAST